MRFTKKRYSFAYYSKSIVKLEVYSNYDSLKKSIVKIKSEGLSLGFIPTMGALHEGHLSLIDNSIKENNYTLVTIFVNPLQFNNPEDLKKYPRTLTQDKELINTLESKNILLYLPIYEELFPENDAFIPVNLNGMDREMEGKYRPGHFDGVVHVIHNLFKQISPDRAYFGEKDFQQLAIIKHITKEYNFKIEIVACKTIRSIDGLALSSRNKRLNETEKKDALILYKSLNKAKELKEIMPPKMVLNKIKSLFKNHTIELEYIYFVDADTLEELHDEWSENSVCCIAAYCNDVRLIDCMNL